MKKITLLLLLITVYHCSGQNNTPPNFYEIRKSFYERWDARTKEDPQIVNEKDNELTVFKRWENFIEPRVYPTGDLYDPSILFQEYKKLKNSSASYKQASNSGKWTLMGPSVVGAQPNPINGHWPGLGRVNCITFHPTDSSTFWVGAAVGGIWKTINGGANWTCNTDLLPNLGVSEIVVDSLDPNVMYLATGDKYGPDVFTLGVLKSTDAGVTWNPTGLNFQVSGNMLIHRLLIQNSDPKLLLAATSGGIWRTTDSAATWTKVKTGYFYDMEFDVSDPSIVYASTGLAFFRSLDTGATWTSVFNINCINERTAIATTKANDSIVYLLCNVGKVFKSTDKGLTFTSKKSISNMDYGNYTTVLAVSQTNPDELYVGDNILYQSLNGGNSFVDLTNTNNNDYVHVDYHDMRFMPGTNDLYACTDGGVYLSKDNGVTWSDLSNGLVITQFYRLGGTQNNETAVGAGAQDNGTYVYSNNSWYEECAGDGMEFAFDPLDKNIYYYTAQSGYIMQSYYGYPYYIAPNVPNNTPAPWVTTFAINPKNHNILYMLYNDVWKTGDQGYTWNKISSNLGGAYAFKNIVISDIDTSRIYISRDTKICRTMNGGASWTNITAGLPVSAASITYVEVSKNDPDKLWVTLSGFTSGKKVFRSDDAGATWINISGNLPNIPVNCIAHQRNSADVLYAGTDLGVFYTDSTMNNNWSQYNTGLPNVIVNELEIQHTLGKLRAATYGRGLWETDLYNYDTGIHEAKGILAMNIYPNPANDKLTIDCTVTIYGDVIILSIINLLGETVLRETIAGQQGHITMNLDVSKLKTGLYIVNIQQGGKSTQKKISVVK